jgi:ABC transport system ATP-binding/permease protein
MSLLVNAQALEKSFGARPLFTGVSFSIAAGDRVGLVGPNGAGKSTLLRILAGRLSPDAGTVSLQRGLRLGYLEQAPVFAPGATVEATLLEGADDPQDWEAQARAAQVGGELGLYEGNRGGEAAVATLSGGWQKRVALGRELMRRPDLLLLDEPTNHLDVEGITWLEELLAAAPFATVTITHDRWFLRRVATRILELDKRHAGGLLAVDGGYARYVELRAETLAAQERRESVLRNTLRRETEWLRRGAAARTTKQQARIDRAAALAGEVSELELRNTSRAAALAVQGSERLPKRLVEAEGITKSHGGRVLFREESLRLAPGTRLGLLGANGCGKSTLIRVLLGEEPPDAGRIFRADALEVAHFEQNREALDPNATVAETVAGSGDHVVLGGARLHVRGYLDRFLFSPEQTDSPVHKLSGGEQSRLLLARLFLRPANLLVLDEPTNDLDAATLGVLEEALEGFPGAVLLVTHDRYFLDQVATQILAFPPGPPRGAPLARFSDVAQWERWHAEESARLRAQPRAEPTAADAPARTSKRKLGYKDQREYDGMEAAILEAEAELAALVTEMERPEIASDAARLVELGEAVAAARARVDALYSRWAELEARVKGEG